MKIWNSVNVSSHKIIIVVTMNKLLNDWMLNVKSE
jgi:hypothetical protein